VAALVLALLVGACQAKAEWTAWVYPNGGNLLTSVALGPFLTFEDCQQSARNAIRMLPDPASADYECGFRCKPDGAFGNVCDETRK
jgi:hypothetical protein